MLLKALRLALLALCLVPAAARAAEPGVNVADLPVSAAEQDRIAATGAKSARMFLRWARIEQTPGVFTTHEMDNLRTAVAGLVARGVKPTFVLLGVPGWANGGHDEATPPSDMATFASFASRLASDPGLQGKVAAYEIWNEQDGDDFWKQPAGATMEQTYTAMVNAVGPAIRAADPAAVVVLGPTTGNNYGLLQRLYDHGIDRNAFQAVAVHTDTACLDRGPYSYYREEGRIARFTFLGYREVRKTVLANGDDKPIHMTELGWTTASGTCDRGTWAGQKPAGVSAADQALFLQQAFSCLAEDPYVHVAQWFTLKDFNALDPRAWNQELRHYGLLTDALAPKPAYTAFKQVAAAPNGDLRSEACGDFDGPDVGVVSPAPGQQFVGKLDVRAWAKEVGDAGLQRITFTYDGGKKIRNWTEGLKDGEPVGLQPWHGADDLALGKHTVEVRALDNAGNETVRTVEVEKVKTLKSTLTPTFKMGPKVRCKGRTCKVSGKLLRGKAGTPSLGGKVQVRWEWRNAKGKWKKLSGGLKPAHKPFSFTLKAKKAGRWRVKVSYLGQAPWKKASSKTLAFRVR